MDKVSVTLQNKTTGKVQPDTNGFLKWKLEVPPFGHESLDVAYAIKRHAKVKQA